MGDFVRGGFVQGDFVRGDFVLRGILSRGILSGGFCPGGFVLEPYHKCLLYLQKNVSQSFSANCKGLAQR